ncbi:MAG: c-type cytochrome, partial [Planctomycetota bacterium]
FVLGFQGYLDKMVSPSQALHLNVSAWKWGWAVKYPNGAESPEVQYIEFDESAGTKGNQYPIFYVPENTDVTLQMSSQDVIHAFWIPDFRTKMDIYPNRYTGYSFRTPALDAQEQVLDPTTDEMIQGRDMWVFCAEYCGDEHSRMAATLRIVPRATYEAKLEEWGAPKDPVELGKAIHAGRCAICHTLDGSPNTGPTWLNLYGSSGQMADGSTVEKDANYLRESILVPNAKIVAGYAGNMPSFQGQLNDVQLDGLLAFMRSISEFAPEEPIIDGEPAEPAEPDEAASDPASEQSQPSESNDGGAS